MSPIISYLPQFESLIRMGAYERGNSAYKGRLVIVRKIMYLYSLNSYTFAALHNFADTEIKLTLIISSSEMTLSL